MMTGRVTIAAGALALGFATAVAVPALAQNAPSGTSQPSASTAMPATPAPANKAAAAKTAPSHKQAAMHHPMTHTAARTTHHPMHATRMSEANPNAQNAAVDQLNQASLQAAQQGKPFTPSGAKM